MSFSKYAAIERRIIKLAKIRENIQTEVRKLSDICQGENSIELTEDRINYCRFTMNPTRTIKCDYLTERDDNEIGQCVYKARLNSRLN